MGHSHPDGSENRRNQGHRKSGTGGPGHYDEIYNYALGHAGCYEPGSTFKLISLMAALEDGLIDTSQVFDTGSGVWKYHDRTIYDSDYKYGGMARCQ